MDYQMEERGTGLLLWNLRRSQPVCTEEQPNAGRKIHHNRVEMARETTETAVISGGIFFAMAALSVISAGMGDLSMAEQWILSGSGATTTIYLLIQMLRIYEKRT